MVIRPQRISVKYRNGVVPFERSVFKDFQKSLCDVGLYFQQHFRIGWARGLTLAAQASIGTTNTVVENQTDYSYRILSGRKSSDFSPNLIHKLEIATCSEGDVEVISVFVCIALFQTFFE